MAQNVIPSIGIGQFMTMLHMKSADEFATSLDKTKGVLYLDSNNKLCNDNRHFSFSFRKNDPAKNYVLREALVKALADSHVPAEKVNFFRRRLGLSVNNEVLDQQKAYAPLDRREVKQIINSCLGKPKLDKSDYNNVNLPSLLKMATVNKKVGDSIDLFLTNYPVKKGETTETNIDSDSGPGMVPDVKTALEKCAAYFKKDAEALNTFVSSKRDKVDEEKFRTALAENKKAFVEEFLFNGRPIAPDALLDKKNYTALKNFRDLARISTVPSPQGMIANLDLFEGKNNRLVPVFKDATAENYAKMYNDIRLDSPNNWQEDAENLLFDTAALGSQLKDISHELEKVVMRTENPEMGKNIEVRG